MMKDTKRLRLQYNKIRLKLIAKYFLKALTKINESKLTK